MTPFDSIRQRTGVSSSNWMPLEGVLPALLSHDS